ncbi:MAG: hypothetical protein ACXVY8_10670 [Gaiellaceae bacterium]
MIAIAIAALFVVACVVYVALPFLREPEPASDRLVGLAAGDQEALERMEERDRSLAALRELELDHRTGKIADDDYVEQRALLRAEAARALASLEPGKEVSHGEDVHELRCEPAEAGAVLSGLRDAGGGADGDSAQRPS